MSMEQKIKEEILKIIYSDIDKLYDSIEGRFVLEEAHRDLIIKHLNRLKDQFYLIANQSRLS